MPRSLIEPEHQYSLDCMFELGSISPSESYWFSNICDNPNDIMDQLSANANLALGTRDHWDHLLEFERSTSEYAFNAIPISPDPLDCYLRDLRSYNVAISAVSDMEWEHCAPRAERLIQSLNRSFEVISRTTDADVRRIIGKWAEKERQMRRDVQEFFSTTRSAVSAHRANLPKRIPTKKKTQERRLAFQKSYNLAQAAMGKAVIDEFLRKRQIVIEGQLYWYRISLTSETVLTTGGHGQTKLTLLTVSGDEICDLCIHSSNCTLLDHIVSLYVHIKAGEELEILQTANVYNVRSKNFLKDIEFIRGRTDMLGLPEITAEALADIHIQEIQRRQTREANQVRILAQIDLRGLNERYRSIYDQLTIRTTPDIQVV